MNNRKLLMLIALYLCGFFSGIGVGSVASERFHINKPGGE